jgi:type III secretion system chaperone SycN
MSVSTQFTSAVADFGRHLGVDSLQPGIDGAVCLSMGESLRLDLQAGDDEALIVLSKALPFAAGSLLLAVLQRCDRHQTRDWVPQLGLVGMGAECELLMIDRLPQAQLTGDRLVQAFDRLAGWMQDVQELA